MGTFLQAAIAGQVRTLLAGVAGSLVTAGALDASQSENFVMIGSGLVGYAVVAGWSWLQKARTVR